MAEVEMMSVDSEPAVKKQKKPQKKANKNKSDAAKGGVDAKGKNEGEAKKNAHRPNKDIVDLFWLVSNEDAKVLRSYYKRSIIRIAREIVCFIMGPRLLTPIAFCFPLLHPLPQQRRFVKLPFPS